MPLPAKPQLIHGVMVSSTFADLEKHRRALIKALAGQGFAARAMENDAAKADVDLIESSLRMVRDASAYVAVIGMRYGQIPNDPGRNPLKRSITELEFDEAQRLGRPILLFIMGDKHSLTVADVETNQAKRRKLRAFRERAKEMSSDSRVHRIYATFESLEEFSQAAIHSVANLRRFLQEHPLDAEAAPAHVPGDARADAIPAPPALYAEPPYIGSHTFVGRVAQIDVLNDWASPADSHSMLMFDAIGGSGKSILTWTWINQHVTAVRHDWAGRFWYSFYERGAIMADFCRRALAYMTGRPVAEFGQMKTPELADRVLHHLRAQPWLVVLDGLERVLVAYHRYDAAQIPDEQADSPEDQIGRRDPCSAIRPEDDDLLRAFAAASPSKIVITSRLIPRILLNPASQPIQGVLRHSLPGLRPADAELLLRSCGVTGDSQAIQQVPEGRVRLPSARRRGARRPDQRLPA